MKIGIFGAGAIGCYLGVRLSAAGEELRLLARPSVIAVADRLEAVDHAGRRTRGSSLAASDALEVLDGIDVCLVTVKSQDTPGVADALASRLSERALVVSFQNGLDNARTLDRALPAPAVQGVVTYNVFRDAPHRMVQASKGKLVVGSLRADGSVFARNHLARMVDALRRAGEQVDVVADIEGEMAGKLLINLNNGVCAATGLPIAEALQDPDARWCFAACITEGTRVFATQGIRPVSPFVLPLAVIPPALKLPSSIIMAIARGLVDASPSAKPSTLQDLERGRVTEVDALNGAIVSLARELGVASPANAAVVDAIREHEAHVLSGEPPRWLSPKALRKRILAGAAGTVSPPR